MRGIICAALLVLWVGLASNAVGDDSPTPSAAATPNSVRTPVAAVNRKPATTFIVMCSYGSPSEWSAQAVVDNLKLAGMDARLTYCEVKEDLDVVRMHMGAKTPSIERFKTRHTVVSIPLRPDGIGYWEVAGPIVVFGPPAAKKKSEPSKDGGKPATAVVHSAPPGRMPN